MAVTDAQLRDQAVALLEKTTDPYPTWVKKGKPAASFWAKGFATLAQIGATPSALGAQSLPVGPFVEMAPYACYDLSKPLAYSKQRIVGPGPYGDGARFQGYFSGPTTPPEPTPPITLTDLILQLAGEPRALADPLAGTDQAGLWLGAAGNTTRIATSGPWSGMETCCQHRDSTHTDISISMADAEGNFKVPVLRTGLYIEHFSRRLVFDGLTILSVGNGIQGEWAYTDPTYAPDTAAEYPLYPAGKSGSIDVEIRNFHITSSTGWAAFLDAGCCGYNIHDGLIDGLDGIAHPANLAIPSMPNLIDWATIDFRGTGQKELVHDNPIG